MKHGPFGLAPQVFSAGFLVIFFTGAILLSYGMSRRKGYRQGLAATAASYQAQQLPGAPHFGDLMGVWHFKSAARWAGVICGVVLGFGAISIPFSIITQPALFDSGDNSGAILGAVASGAVGLFLITYSLWRPTRAAQQCSVDQRLAVTVMRGGREIPLDLNHYRYARMHTSQNRYGRNRASMLVFDRDRRPGFGALTSSILFPRCDEGRIVVFYMSWTTAAGARIGYNRVDEFFRDVCRRAGHEPRVINRFWSYGTDPWEVRPD